LSADFRAAGACHFCGAYPNNSEHFVIAITAGANPKADYASGSFVAPPGNVAEAGGTYTWKAWFNGVNFYYELTPTGFAEKIVGNGNPVVY